MSLAGRFFCPDMNKRGQVIIIILWILVILTVLAVTIGHRVSLALRLSRYQRDSLKAYSLAKGGINLAIAVLEEDGKKDTQGAPGYDAPDEPWADNEQKFKNISLGSDKDEFATVYYVDKAGGREEIKYGVTDEERKININTADKDLLKALLGECGVANPEDLAKNILFWRGGLFLILLSIRA